MLTGRGKIVIENHFDISDELEGVLRKENKLDALSELQSISSLSESGGIQLSAVMLKLYNGIKDRGRILRCRLICSTRPPASVGISVPSDPWRG